MGPSTDIMDKKLWDRILLSHKKNDVMPLAAISMDLEDIILSKISQRKRNNL